MRTNIQLKKIDKQKKNKWNQKGEIPKIKAIINEFRNIKERWQ